MAEQMVMFSMRMPLELKIQLDRAARLDQRSTASLLQVIARAWLSQKPYTPSFDLSNDTAEIDQLRGELRAVPGRPRIAPNPRLNVEHAREQVLASIAGKDRVTLADVVEASNGIPSPTPMVLVREVLFREGWREYRNSLDERVWVKEI